MKIPRSIKAVSAAAVLAFSFAAFSVPVSAQCSDSNAVVITVDKSSKAKKGWVKKNGKTYVVVVMVEHGGGGSSVAGPVAKKVYEHLFGPVGQPSF